MISFFALFLGLSVGSFAICSPHEQVITNFANDEELAQFSDFGVESQKSWQYAAPNRQKYVDTPTAPLPQDTFPLWYDLRIDADPDHPAFKGEVGIKIWVREVTNVVSLHCLDLTVISADISRLDKKLPSNFQLDHEKQILNITTAYELISDYSYVVTIKYNGTMRDYPRGLYRRSYQEGNVKK